MQITIDLGDGEAEHIPVLKGEENKADELATRFC